MRLAIKLLASFFAIWSCCGFTVLNAAAQSVSVPPSVANDREALKDSTVMLQALLAKQPLQSSSVREIALDGLSRLKRLLEYELSRPANEDRRATAVLNYSDSSDGGTFSVYQAAFEKLGMTAQQDEVWRLRLKGQSFIESRDSEWSRFAAPIELSSAALIDRTLFRECLRIWFAGKPDDTSKNFSPDAAAARYGSGALESAGEWNLARLWRSELIAILQEGGQQPPDALARAYLELGALETNNGTSTLAEKNLRQALALHQSGRSMLKRTELGLLFAYLAELADTRLDPKTAVVEFANMANIVGSLPLASLQSGVDANDATALWRVALFLLRQHAKGQFCSECSVELVPLVKTIVRRALAEEGEHGKVLGILRTMSNGQMFSDEILALESRLLESIEGLFDGTRVAIRASLKTRGQLVVAAALAGDLGAADSPTAIPSRYWHVAIKQQPIPPQNLAYELCGVEKDLGQDDFGGERFFEWLLNVSENLLAFGLKDAARQHLGYFLRRLERLHANQCEQGAAGLQPITDNERKDIEKRDAERAPLFGPGIVAYARLLVDSGSEPDLRSASKALDRARDMIQRRISRDWSASSDQVIIFMRRMEPTLKEIATLRTTLHTRLKVSSLGIEDLASSYQAALISDVGIALMASMRKRIEASPKALSLISQSTELSGRLRAAQEADAIIRKAPLGPTLVAELMSKKSQLDKELYRLLPNRETVASLSPIQTEAVKKLLLPSESLAIVLTSPLGVFGCLIEASGIITPWKVSIPLSEVESALKAVRQGAEPVGDRWPRFPVKTSYDLFQMIFGPVSTKISTAKKLIIVPDATLQSVPFGVLLTEEPNREPLKASDFRSHSFKWLARSAAITVLPTLNTLVTQRSAVGASSSLRPFGGIGNPVLASPGSGARSIEFRGLFRKGPYADVNVLRSLASLPETEQELRTIGTALGADPEDIYLGDRATERAIKAADLGKYRILAFATHALVAGQFGNGSEPGLVLSPPLKATREDDGFLSMSEIMALKLDADLVILSACSTATSDGRPRAEGLSGLARAFFSAGARSLVVTHWTIPSAQAVKVTTTMISERQRDSSIDWAEALQRSVVNLIDNDGDPSNAHPASWGAFMLVGTHGIGRAHSGSAMSRNESYPVSKQGAISAGTLPSFDQKGWSATIENAGGALKSSGSANVTIQKSKHPLLKSQPTPPTGRIAKADPITRPAASTGAMLGASLQDVAGNPASFIAVIVPGSPADKAGLRPGDVLMGARNEVSGAMPKDLTAMVLTDYFKRQKPGDSVRIWYDRKGTKYQATAILRAWQ